MRASGRPIRWLVACALAGVAVLGCSKAFRRPARPTVALPAAEQRLSELWSDPGDIAGLDLYSGPGGQGLMPKPGETFQFVAEDRQGFSPGWEVRDGRGVQWSVKLGVEAQSELVASRILWAMGYRQLPSYHVSSWNLAGGPRPGRGDPGRFRALLPGTRPAGEWSWEANPFAETQVFRGLLVLMRIINNWDLLDGNNAVYEFDAPRDGVSRWFVVRDLGASFGRTRTLSRRSGTRNDVEDYERQGYIEGVDEDGAVEFDQLGKWHRGLFAELRVEDVRWISERLSRLTRRQWDDAFRAAEYEPEVAGRFIAALLKRIEQGRTLGLPGEPSTVR